MHTSLNHCCPANKENKSLLAGADGAGGTWVLNASVSPLFLTSQTQKEFGMYQNGPACKFHLALKLSHEEQLTALHMHGREQPLCLQLGSRWQPAGQALEWQPVLAALPKLADLPSASLGRARPAPSSLLIEVLDQSPAKQSHTASWGDQAALRMNIKLLRRSKREEKRQEILACLQWKEAIRRDHSSFFQVPSEETAKDTVLG